MRILALDLGTFCGWAVSSDGHVEGSGTWDLAPARQRRFEGGGMRWLRLNRFLGEVGRVDLVAFEEVRRHMGVDAAHAYGGAMAVVTAWCENQPSKVPYVAVPVGQIKKFATGKGNAGKQDVVAAARAKFGLTTYDDNEADALALLHLAVAEYGS